MDRPVITDEMLYEWLMTNATKRYLPSVEFVEGDCIAFPGEPGRWEPKGVFTAGSSTRPHFFYKQNTMAVSRFVACYHGLLRKESRKRVHHMCGNQDWCITPEHLYVNKR